MSNAMITDLRAKREALLSTLEAVVTAGVEENRDLTEAEDANVTATRAEITKYDNRIKSLVDIEERKSADAELGARFGKENKGITHVGEAELYRADGEFEFFKDVAAQHRGDTAAAQRLFSHNEQHRATVSSDLGGFVVPTYATNLYAGYLTEGRPTADVVRKEVLPKGGSVIVPRQSSEVAVASQNPQNTAGGNGDFKANNDLVVNATTIIGHTDVSRQSLDFGSAPESVIIGDLYRKYNELVDLQVLNGAGTSGTMKGIYNATGITTVAGAGVTDIKKLYAAVNKAKLEVRKGVKADASHLVCTPDLWAFIESSTDADGRPLFGFDWSSPTNVQGTGKRFAGLNVIVDSNIPNTLPTAQTALVMKADENLLFEGGLRTIRAEEVAAHTGTVRFVLSGYVAFTAERRGAANSKITALPPLALV